MFVSNIQIDVLTLSLDDYSSKEHSHYGFSINGAAISTDFGLRYKGKTLLFGLGLGVNTGIDYERYNTETKKSISFDAGFLLNLRMKLESEK